MTATTLCDLATLNVDGRTCLENGHREGAGACLRCSLRARWEAEGRPYGTGGRAPEGALAVACVSPDPVDPASAAGPRAVLPDLLAFLTERVEGVGAASYQQPLTVPDPSGRRFAGEALEEAADLLVYLFAARMQDEGGSAAAWEDTARQESRNAAFYRGIVERCGKAFGVAARAQDDGGVVDDVLALKVPELVEAAVARLDQLDGRWRRFNEAVGTVGYVGAAGPTGAHRHPDRCVCQGDDPTPHKHRDEPPHACARCTSCDEWRAQCPA